MTKEVIYEKRAHIGYVTLNRPEVHNCINIAMSNALLATWDEIKSDPDVRVVILTGAGDKAFCSGADLKQLIPHINHLSETENRRRAYEGPGWCGMSGGYVFNVPLIGAINGFCIAGGHELAEFCDIRIAAEHATFGHQEVRWGLMPGDGGCTRLQRIVGLGRAMEIILTGRLYDAREAERIGFVNRVVPAGELMAHAEEIATKIAANGPLATRAAKEAVLFAAGHTLTEGIAFENDGLSYLSRTEDWQSGQRSFLTKKAANFVSR